MKCPGQDSRYWQPGAIFEAKCPQCGREVEFFKDESTRRCKGCGHKFVNPRMDFGCATYCKFAEQCLGDLPPELIAQKQDLLKDRVAVEVKKYFGRDFKRIAHATKVARYAGQLVKEEMGDPAVVLIAAYLHDVGAKEAQEKNDSTEATSREREGESIARDLLGRLGAREELIAEVCDIIAHHHHAEDIKSTNLKVLFDADLLTNLEEKKGEETTDRDALVEYIDQQFLTDAGRKLARSILLD